MAKKKLPQNVYYLGLGVAILVAMMFTLSQNGHSYETTYELGVPEIYGLSVVNEYGELVSWNNKMPITTPLIKCELKQTTSVIDGNSGTKHRLIQSKFIANQNPQLSFYELDDPNKQRGNDKAISSFIVEPKIRCVNTILADNNQKENQFEIAPSELTMRYFATDEDGKRILMAQEKKMINNNYIALKWGTETGSKPDGCDWNQYGTSCLAVESFKDFNIGLTNNIENKLPNGNYESTHTFQLDGEIKVNFVGFRDTVYTLPVYAQDIRTETVFQVVKGSGYQPPTLGEKIAECKAKNGVYTQVSNDKAECIVCPENWSLNNNGSKCLPPKEKPEINCPTNTEWDESVEACRVIVTGNGNGNGGNGNGNGNGGNGNGNGGNGNGTTPEPTTPKPEPEPTTPSWLEKTFSELQDCSKRSDISGVAFCMIQIEAFYLTGVGILAIGIAGQIFNRRSSGYYGV